MRTPSKLRRRNNCPRKKTKRQPRKKRKPTLLVSLKSFRTGKPKKQRITKRRSWVKNLSLTLKKKMWLKISLTKTQSSKSKRISPPPRLSLHVLPPRRALVRPPPRSSPPPRPRPRLASVAGVVLPLPARKIQASKSNSHLPSDPAGTSTRLPPKKLLPLKKNPQLKSRKIPWLRKLKTHLNSKSTTSHSRKKRN